MEYVPLVDSPHVIKAMKTGGNGLRRVRYATTVAGMVLETFFTKHAELLFGENYDEYPSPSFSRSVRIFLTMNSGSGSVAYSGDQTVKIIFVTVIPS